MRPIMARRPGARAVHRVRTPRSGPDDPPRRGATRPALAGRDELTLRAGAHHQRGPIAPPVDGLGGKGQRRRGLARGRCAPTPWLFVQGLDLAAEGVEVGAKRGNDRFLGRLIHRRFLLGFSRVCSSVDTRVCSAVSAGSSGANAARTRSRSARTASISATVCAGGSGGVSAGSLITG